MYPGSDGPSALSNVERKGVRSVIHNVPLAEGLSKVEISSPRPGLMALELTSPVLKGPANGSLRIGPIGLPLPGGEVCYW